MNDQQLTSIHQLEEFLDGAIPMTFRPTGIEAVYAFVSKTLISFAYYKCSRYERGVIRSYLAKITGYSTSQLTRLIYSNIHTGRVVRKKYTRHVFPTKYSREDVILLAQTDTLHDTPNGKSVKRTLEREAVQFHKSEFQNLSHISVSHIYNFRKEPIYQRLNLHYEKTKPVKSQIGVRKKPTPDGSPGFLRVDSVHQGDIEREKGVYHINIVDEVTQFEFMGAVEHISESYLLPMLEKLIDLFPFEIKEIHSDNGSEYINQMVARLLDKLRINLTKSRSRKSNDNALVESKNGAVIRKWIGYSFLPKGYAKWLNLFYFGCFHEYINYHRPCAFPTVITDSKGKQKKVYLQADYQTPFEKLLSLPDCTKYLKSSVTIETLTTLAARHSDNEMAALVQQERSKLFCKTNQ